MRPPLAHHLDDSIGEALPASACMRAGIALLHRQRGIEHQHALIRPMLQIAVTRRIDVQIALELLENVLQRRRWRNARLHGEAQPMGLAGAVVGVLSENDHLNPLQRCRIQRIEDQRPRWIDDFASRFLTTKESRQLVHVRLIELLTQRIPPARFELDSIILGHRFTFACDGAAAP